MDFKKLSTYEASMAFYNLFFRTEQSLTLFDYLNNSFCDTIIEINVKENRFKITSQVENKYSLVISDGTYINLFDMATEYGVHPDDREIYIDLMDPKTILDKLKNSKTPNFRFAHFRYKLRDGSWRWSEQAIITGEENGIPEGIVYAYIFDIQNNKSRELGFINDEKNMFINEVDDITNLYVEKYFIYRANKLVNEKNDIKWSAISLDIEHFSLFDQWYGRDSGNFLLAKIGQIFLSMNRDWGGVSGYLGQDHFIAIVEDNEQIYERLYKAVLKAIRYYSVSSGFLPAIGICRVNDANNLQDAIDKSNFASSLAKKSINRRVVVYDPFVKTQNVKDYKMVLDVMEALKNEEITFYLQPQCRLSTGKVVGAEALARWVKKDGTVVPPGAFIPLLEKYGFITEFDKYIWESVCKWIKKMKDEGKLNVQVSLNISLIDVSTIDLAEYFDELIKKYNLSPDILKIEITESAYAQTSEEIKNLVDNFHKNGFHVLMDDFGSGYSSLNVLRSLDVDVLKLDAAFLDLNGGDFNKGVHILESVINMAKVIGIPIIVEGVETEEQVKFLEELGCRYVQGYHFYKPMPYLEFAKLISNPDNVDPRGFIVKTNEQIRVREFIDENIYSDTMLNNILGAVAFYSWKGREQVDIIRFNQQFYESVDDSNFHGRLENIQNFLPPDDRPKIYELLQEAIDNKLNGSRGSLRFIKTDNNVVTFYMKFYYLGVIEGSHRFYGSANNISEFAEMRQQMSLINKFSSDTIIFLKKKEEKWSCIIAANGLENITGISTPQLEKELSDFSFFNRLEKYSKDEIQNTIVNSLNNKYSFSIVFTMDGKDNKRIAIRMQCDPVYDQADNIEYILAFRLA